MTLTANIKDSRLLLFLFHAWTFILIARPQDYIAELATVRPALSAGIIVILFYWCNHARYKNSILGNQQCRLYLFLLVAMVFSIPFAYYRRGAFEFFFVKYLIVALYLFLFYKIIDREEKIKNILWTACLGNSLYLLSALQQGESVAGRLRFGQMLDPNDLAFFAVSFLPLNFIYISSSDTWWKRIIALVNITLSIMIILMTGSRGGFLALGIVSLLLFFTRAEVVKTSYKIIVGIMTIIALIYAGSTIDFSRLETMTQIGGDYNVWDETGRLEVWKKGLLFMLSDPLTGVGVSCFGEAIGTDRLSRGMQDFWQAPHNSLVQIGAETGVLGLYLFIHISYRAYEIFGKVRKKDGDQKNGYVAELTQIAFIGHLAASMFLSQAYSGIWVLFVALSASLLEQNKTAAIQLRSQL